MSEQRLQLERGAYLRRATPADLDAVLAIKRALALQPGQPAPESFLLGSDDLTYARMLTRERMWLLVADGHAIGFTLTLDGELLQDSALWRRRSSIEWRPEFDATTELDARVGYFDQLAVLPAIRCREWSACLALCALAELIDDDAHERVLTTTVIEPVSNRAALPYLAHLRARQIAELDEHYAEVGTIRSAMHVIEEAGFWAYVEGLTGARRPSIEHIVDGVARAVQLRDWRLLNPPD